MIFWKLLKPANNVRELQGSTIARTLTMTMLTLTLLMLRLLSSNTQEHKDFGKTPKPSHVGIHWIALAEYSQMRTHVQGFQSFFRFYASFGIGEISHQQHKG